MRKLVSIRKIKEIRPHINADSLELAIVDGWQIVVKKGNFLPGEVVVYFEVDSVIPTHNEAFEFLRKSCYVKKDWIPRGEGFRIRTICLRNELSQGLIMPLHLLPIGIDKLETDVTEILGVVKWDPPVPAELAGVAKGNFPSWIPKTDAERAQNLVERIFGEYKDEKFEVSLKLDGSSCTIYHNDGEIGVCSRNMDLEISEENKNNSFVKIARESGILAALMKIGKNVAIQGELMGPGVQKNRERLPTHKLFIFNVFDIDKQTYFSLEDRLEFLPKLYGLCRDTYPKIWSGVSVIDFIKPSDFKNLENMLKFAEGDSINNPVREGLVWKSLKDPNFSFKTISNEYLLKEK